MSNFIKKSFLMIGCASLISLGACAQDTDKKQAQSELPAPVSTMDTTMADANMAPAPTLQSHAGSYLAGRHAQSHKDWGNAYQYLGQAYDQDQNNLILLHRTFLLAIGNGEMARAKNLAKQLLATDSNPDLALVFLGIDAMAENDYAQSQEYMADLTENGLGQFTRPIITAWNHAANQDFDAAITALDGAKEFAAIFYFHAGMIAEYTNHVEEAKSFYRTAMHSGLSVQETMMVAAFFQRHGDADYASLIYSSILKQEPDNPFTAEIQRRLGDIDNAPQAQITQAAHGAAMGVFSLASILYEKKAYESAIIYAQLVKHMAPDSGYIDVMIGDIFAIYEQFSAAIKHYSQVKQESGLYWLSQLRQAEIYELSEQFDLAIAKLKSISDAADPYLKRDIDVFLGDLYRRQGDFEQAVATYSHVLNQTDVIAPSDWSIVYARAISYEKIDQWQKAELDLLTAIDLNPENAMILNYLGYSWADRGMHLERALGFIEKAVALEPNDPYILDSYGWVLYRTGKFEESVNWLERAAEQMPNDATINDHLGDAYWQVGRYDEAKTQWLRSTRLKPTDDLLSSIENKLKHGLTTERILEQEARLQ